MPSTTRNAEERRESKRIDQCLIRQQRNQDDALRLILLCPPGVPCRVICQKLVPQTRRSSKNSSQVVTDALHLPIHARRRYELCSVGHWRPRFWLRHLLDDTSSSTASNPVMVVASLSWYDQTVQQPRQPQQSGSRINRLEQALQHFSVLARHYCQEKQPILLVLTEAAAFLQKVKADRCSVEHHFPAFAHYRSKPDKPTAMRALSFFKQEFQKAASGTRSSCSNTADCSTSVSGRASSPLHVHITQYSNPNLTKFVQTTLVQIMTRNAMSLLGGDKRQEDDDTFQFTSPWLNTRQIPTPKTHCGDDEDGWTQHTVSVEDLHSSFGSSIEESIHMRVPEKKPRVSFSVPAVQ